MTDEEWILLQIFENPVMFREFIHMADPSAATAFWHNLQDHERAWSSCTGAYVAMCCGRGVYKTTSMIELAFYWAINGMFLPGDPGLIIFVPNKSQKDAIFPKFQSACTTHWLLRYMTDENHINVSEGRIDFYNGFRLLLRIAGSTGKESNVISVHGPRIWVDEAQDFPWRAWLSLQNILRFDAPDHMLWVSGVPNGGRQENVLFECDQADDKYIPFNIGQPMMSWWTPEIEYERRKQYHALQDDSEDYKHYVLGQHGVPTYTVFDRTRFRRAKYDIEKVVITQHMFETSRREDPDGQLRYHVEEVIMCPMVPMEFGIKPKIGIGYDPGYSPDPAVFFIMYQDTQSGRWRNLIRYSLQRVEYALQREVLAWLDRVYQFDFLGMDMGGPGKVQYQDLASDLSVYRPYNYIERMYPVEFGGMIVVALNEAGEEKKDQVKRVAVETLSRWVHEQRFEFSEEDDDLMDELERTKLQRTITGEPIYKTENDHQMSAMMCAILAYENRFGPPLTLKREITPKLLGARWLDVRAAV